MSIASLYPSINPSLLLDFANSKVLDPRITFTRTTTATYYDGVTTAKAEQNLLTYSQEFDNAAWTTQNCTVGANATTAPDGTSTAESVVASNAVNSASGLYRGTPSATTQSLSFYVKAGNKTFAMIITQSGAGNNNAWFNLGTGAVGTKGSNITSSAIESVGNSWYRISIIRPYASGNIGVYFTDADNSQTCTGNGSTVSGYVWGAQLEDRSSLTAYTATTSQAITNYIPVLQTAAAGQARFDHNPTTGESLGLLIEEARTNLATYSEDFTAWTALSATASGNATIAPNGTLTADKMIPSSTGSNRGLYRTFTASGATTVSVYAKYGGYQWFYLAKPDGSNIGVSFDILNGVKGTEQSGVTGTITSVGNGWYRCTCTQTYTGTAYVQLGVASADNSSSVTVATNDVLSGTFIWGAQAETSGSSFATSYIPNLSTGSTTRNADAASMTGTNFSSWFNNGEGTVYFEAQPMYVGTATSSLNSWLWDGTNSNIITIGQNSGYGSAVGIDALVQINGSIVAYGGTTTGVTTASAFKSIAAYEFNNTGAYLNGASFLTDTSCTIPVVNQWKFGGNFALSNTSNGWVRKLSYYPQRLSATNLAALTT